MISEVPGCFQTPAVIHQCKRKSRTVKQMTTEYQHISLNILLKMFPHFKVAKTAQITLYNKTSNAQTGNRFAQFAYVRIITELFGLEGTS